MSQVMKTLPLAVVLALASGPVFALGLGPIEIKSQLNQPLLAEIPLIGARPAELEALSVRLASSEAFERVGLPAPAGVTANLQFSIGRNARGEPVVRVTTPGRVQDPFVSFLLEADWGRGSVVREFTVLIDPPHIAAATVAPVRAATVAAPVTPAAAPVAAPLPEPPPPRPEPLPAPVAAPSPSPAAPAPAPVAPLPAPAPVPAPAPPPAPEPVVAAAPIATGAAVRQHRVVAGDTLWSIAGAHRDQVSAAQMMLAIQRANPEAFARDNINLLRSGAVLRIPTAAEAQSLARLEAEASVREQMAAWRTLSGAPAPTPTPIEGQRAAAAPPRPADSARPVAAAAPPAASGRLEIAPPVGQGPATAQTGARVGGEGTELRAELQQTREELSAREAELREVRSRLTEQEALASEQQRLIELKDSQLSALEENLRRQREAEAAAAGTDVATTPPPEAVVAAPTPVAAPEALAEPVAAPAWWRQPLVLAGGGLLLVGGLLALLLRRRTQSAAAPALASALPNGRSRLSDDPDLFSGLPGSARQEAVAPASDPLPEVEALASDPGPAQVADEARAEHSPDPVLVRLQDELAADPLDLEAHVALLRQHYNAGDAEAFLAAAETMREQVTESGDPRWREVVVMGMGLVPGHALFREVLWNPIKAQNIQTREPASPPVSPPPPETEASEDAAATQEGFDATITAQRPAQELAEGGAAEDLDDTRLELAKAYIEIGDVDGARGMLEEVLIEGGESARAEAERLLKSIG